MRSGEVSEYHGELVEARLFAGKSDFTFEHDIDEVTQLYTHNVDVDALNDKKLAQLSGNYATYAMRTKGRKPLI